MKAVILVGGEGTRLRPLTCNTTKAMVPVLNKPFLEHLLGYLKGHGVTDIILAMSYLPHHIQGHFGDGTKMGVRLSYCIEEEPLGTAGAVKNAEDFKAYSISCQEYLGRLFLHPAGAAVFDHHNPTGNHLYAFSIKNELVDWLDPKSPAYRPQ